MQSTTSSVLKMNYTVDLDSETASPELLTVDHDLTHANMNNNNKRLPDLVNQENEFWVQPAEEAFYIPQPPSTLIPPLPFTQTTDGLQDFPQDANWLFGDAGSEADHLEMIEMGIADDGIDLYADLVSPERTSDLSDDDNAAPSRSHNPTRNHSPMASETDEFVMEALEDIFCEVRSVIVDNTPGGNDPGFDPLVETALKAIRNYDVIRASAQALLNDSRNEEVQDSRDTEAGHSRWYTGTSREASYSAVVTSRWDRLPTFSSRTSLVVSVTSSVPRDDSQPLKDDWIDDRDELDACPNDTEFSIEDDIYSLNNEGVDNRDGLYPREGFYPDYNYPVHSYTRGRVNEEASDTSTGDRSGIDILETLSEGKRLTSELRHTNEWAQTTENVNSHPGSSGISIMVNGVPINEALHSGHNVGGDGQVEVNRVPITNDSNSGLGQSGNRLTTNFSHPSSVQNERALTEHNEDGDVQNNYSANDDWKVGEERVADHSDSGSWYSVYDKWTQTEPPEPPGALIDITEDINRWLEESQGERYDTDSLFSHDNDEYTLPRLSHSDVDMRSVNRKRKLCDSVNDVLETKSDSDLIIPCKRMCF